MSENKGKPSGGVARNKKDVGKHGDLKEIGSISGANKKALSDDAGIFIATGGGHPHKHESTSKIR